MILEVPTLEAVYYPCQIPSGSPALTQMGLIFDKVHFPNVYLPTDGYDVEAVQKEADRLIALKSPLYSTHLLIGLLRFLPHVKDLEGFCVFNGTKGQAFGSKDPSGAGDPRLGEIVKALDEELHGPPPPDFFPSYHTGANKSLPGGEAYIDYPGEMHYPATAMLYAADNKLPLINDNPHMPVPAFGNMDAKDNAKLLAAILAMECANLVLPQMPMLYPHQIMETRAELAKHLTPFRTSLLRLSASLNKAITASSTSDEIISAARFIVETEVQPTLLELQDQLNSPSRPWYGRAFDLAKQAPELATAYASMPLNMALARTLAALGGVLVDMHSAKEKQAATRSPMYYLLKLGEVSKSK